MGSTECPELEKWKPALHDDCSERDHLAVCQQPEGFLHEADFLVC